MSTPLTLPWNSPKHGLIIDNPPISLAWDISSQRLATLVDRPEVPVAGKPNTRTVSFQAVTFGQIKRTNVICLFAPNLQQIEFNFLAATNHASLREFLSSNLNAPVHAEEEPYGPCTIRWQIDACEPTYKFFEYGKEAWTETLTIQRTFGDSMYQLLRETPWIKEWQTPHGSFIDSKLRWLGVEPNADAFLAAWRAASAPEKFDLEAAFQFYPYELEDDIDRILTAIAAEDEPRARRMDQNLFRADAKLGPNLEKFLQGLGEHLEATAAPMRLVGENRWFAAFANDAGFHIDTKITSPFDMPTPEELQAHADASLSLAYRRLLITVKENPWLLEPRPGESPGFPG